MRSGSSAERDRRTEGHLVERTVGQQSHVPVELIQTFPAFFFCGVMAAHPDREAARLVAAAAAAVAIAT